MKHTQGPWKFGKELSSRAGEWLISFDAGNKGRGVEIAETRVGSGKESGNARLIAAAPDLLDALKEATAVLEAFKFQSQTASQVLGEVYAVIAKATGEANEKVEVPTTAQ